MSSGINHTHESTQDDASLETPAIVKVTSHLQASAQAERKDDGKAPMALLDPLALEGTAAVLAFGAKKYAAHNWQKGMPWSKVIGSLLRHTFKFMSGEDLDQESGLPHVDHVCCNAMFLANYYRRHKAYDDRFKGGEKS